METINLKNFDEFESVFRKETEELENLKATQPYAVMPNLLYRGQSKAGWDLETTLERYLLERGLPSEVKWDNYAIALIGVNQKVFSFTQHRYMVEYESIKKRDNFFLPPFLDFMAYTRHHGFPSPYLDWSISPYVAAFFAYSSATSDEDVAIFSFLETSNGGKGHIVTSPHISGIGSYLKTHERHHIQQCEYTICHRIEGGIDYYCPFMRADFSNYQNRVRKYILPSVEKFKVLERLDKMNINMFTLFPNEDGLMDMLAFRELSDINS